MNEQGKRAIVNATAKINRKARIYLSSKIDQQRTKRNNPSPEAVCIQTDKLESIWQIGAPFQRLLVFPREECPILVRSLNPCSLHIFRARTQLLQNIITAQFHGLTPPPPPNPRSKGICLNLMEKVVSVSTFSQMFQRVQFRESEKNSKRKKAKFR